MGVILEEQKQDEYALSLTCGTDLEVASFKPISMVIEEGLNYTSPLMKLNVVDLLGELNSDALMPPNETFKLKIGSGPDNIEEFEFELSKMEMGNTQLQNPSRISTEIYFLIKNWNDFINKRHNRSWNGDEYSDVVESIASEASFNPDVEKTEPFENLGKKRDKNIIYQLNWTNHKMVQWIANRAKSSSNGCGGFQYGVKINKDFIFKTLNELYKGSPVLKLEYTPAINKEENLKNGDAFIYQLQVIYDYATNIKNYGSGSKFTWFDYNKKETNSDEVDIKSTGVESLSDNFYLAQDHLDYKSYYFGGMDTKTKDVVETNVASSVYSIQKLKILIKGNKDIHIGDKVKLYIASAKDTKINEQLSGEYIISELKHRFSFEKGNQYFNTELILLRGGPNGGVSGLV